MKLDRVYSTHHNVGDSYGCTEWRELTAQIAQVIGSEQGDCIKVSQLSMDHLYSQWQCCVLMHTWFVYHCTPDLQVLALVCHKMKSNGENSNNSIHFWLTGMNIFPKCSVIKVIKNSCPLSSVTLASTEEVNEFPLNDFKL